MLRHRFRLQNLLLLAAAFAFYGWWDVRFVYLIALSTALDYSTGLLIGHDKMSWIQRLAVTAWLAVAALVSLAIRWDAFEFSLRPLGLSVAWSMFWTRNRAIWLAIGFSAVSVLLAHLAYPLLMRLDDPARRKLTLTLSIIANLGLLGFFKYFNFFVDSFRDLWTLAFGTTPDLFTFSRRAGGTGRPIPGAAAPGGPSCYDFPGPTCPLVRGPRDDEPWIPGGNSIC